MIVPDASAVVAALLDSGADGEWALAALRDGALVAPHILHSEVANVIRRLELSGEVSSDAASLAFHDLRMMPVQLVPFEVCADRVWELRSTVTSYDAWYVAVAEMADAPLVTLDRRLAAAPGLTCRLALPPTR